MTGRCFCYAVDAAYLFPAVASAIHLRQALPPGAADVLVFGIGMEDVLRRAYGPACDAAGVRLLDVDRRDLDGLSGLYASLFLDRYLPDSYGTAVFLDNDVQFWGRPEALFEVDTGGAPLAAVADPMAFMLDQPGRRSAALARYMDGLGLRGALGRRYFNTGLLRIERRGWPALCAEALRFLRTSPDACHYADQSALNAASGGAHAALSLRWNFPIFLRNAGVERGIDPVMYHFMARPKPWQGGFHPWGERYTEPYAALLRAHPSLHAHAAPLSRGRRARYLVQQAVKGVNESITWRFGPRRRQILDYERQVAAAAVRA